CSPDDTELFFPCKQPEILNHTSCSTVVFIPLFLLFRFFHNHNEKRIWFIQECVTVCLSLFRIGSSNFFSEVSFFIFTDNNKTPWLSHAVCRCPYCILYQFENCFFCNFFIIITFFSCAAFTNDFCQLCLVSYLFHMNVLSFIHINRRFCN